MAKDAIMFGAGDKPAGNAEEAQMRTEVSGIGGDPDDYRREIAATTQDLTRVSDAPSRQALQDHLKNMQGQLVRLGDAPGRSSTIQFGASDQPIKWGEADQPAAQRTLPANVAPSVAGAGRGSVQPPLAQPAATPAAPAQPEPVFAQGPQQPLGDPMGTGAAEIANAPANAPQAGPGRGTVNPPLIGEDTREDVGVVKSLGLGYGKAGASSMKVFNLAVAAPIVLGEKLKNAITGSSDTSGQDAVFRNLIDPVNEAVNWYSLDSNQKQGFLSKVAESVGGLAQDLPLMIASGGQAAEAKLAQAFPTMTQFVGNAVGQGFTAMRPLMIKSGVEKAQQVLDAGGSVKDALNSAATAAMITGFTGSQPLSASGKALERALTGIPVGAATSEGRRVIQNAADPANVQEPFSPEGVAVGAVTNSAMALSMGHPGHVDASVTQSRIEQLRAAGEKDAADLMDKQLTNTKVSGELGALGHVAQDPAFQAAYREQRLNGAKPAEAAARAGMSSTFDALSAAAGVPDAAVKAARDKAADLPLDKVPGFFEKFVASITSKGLGKPMPAGTVDSTIGAARDQALNAAVERVYNPAAALDAIKRAAEAKPTAAEETTGAPESEPIASQKPDFVPGNDIIVTPEAESAHQAATSPLNDTPEPTQAQKDAGNYKVGRLNIGGLDISVENPQGSVRRGVDAQGKPWETPLQDHYGYIRGTVGADKDHLDVFVKPGTAPEYRGPVFVVDQIDPATGRFDEHKAVLGAADKAEAEQVYRRNYGADWKGLGAITELPMPAFKAWSKSTHAKEPLGDLTQAQPEAAAAPSAVPAEVQPAADGARGDNGAPEQPDSSLISPQQLAARAKAASRLGLPNTSPKGEPIPAHSFIAAEGGMSRAAMSDMGFDRNVRIGNRTVFAGKGKGMTLEQATELLKEHGYLPPDAGHTDTANLIAKSMKSPQYTPEGWTRIAEAEAHTRFEDHLAAQRESDEDPFGPLSAEELEGIGPLSTEQRDELRALVEAAKAEGIDAETLLEDAHQMTQNGDDHDYRQQATALIESARASRGEAAAGEGAEQGRQDAQPEGVQGRDARAGEQGAARREGVDAGRALPVSGSVERPAETGVPGRDQGRPGVRGGDGGRSDAGGADTARPAATTSWTLNASGTLAVKGDTPEALRKLLADNGITRVMLGKDGVLVGKTEAAQAEKVLTKLRGKVAKAPAAAAEAKPLAVGMTPANAEPVTVKDGIVHIGKAEAINFDTGEAVKVQAGASEADIKQALRDAGALSKRQKFFGGEAKVAEPEGLTSPTKEDVLDQQRQAEEGAAAEASAKKEGEQRAAADAQRSEFDLTGSDRPADANPKQQGMFARGDHTEPFYSALAREVGAIPAKAQSAQGWAEQIKGLVAKGKVKADEVAWTGLDDWLSMQQGKVTREQIGEFLKNNGVQVQEVTKGDLNTALPKGWTVAESTEEPGHWEVLDDQGVMRGDGENRAEAIESAQDHDERTSSDAKYGQYTLPGGENYREVLLTLPVKQMDEMPPGFSVHQDDAGRWGVKFPDGRTVGGWLSRQAAVDSQRRQPGQPTYRSGHWDEPNVLAHIRLNDRTDADGKRVLFVEELQSDWAQEGKKKGFGPSAAERAEADALTKRADAAGGVEKLSEAEQARARELGFAIVRGSVPNAPFVGKTDAWLSLALKRIVKMAADEGYDKVAFVNGEQSADRYDLSKKISKIEYHDANSGGIGKADLKAPEDSGTLTAYDHNGKAVIDKHVRASELEEYIGKDAAKKLLESKPREARRAGLGMRERTLEGLDLKVGGEGMKAFYDKIVPSVAKEVARKLGGGPLTEVRIPKTEAKIKDISYADLRDNLKQVARGVMSHEEFFEEHPDLRNTVTTDDLESIENRDRHNGYRNAPLITGLVDKVRASIAAGKSMKQSGFDITPAMREKAEGGLPLFARSNLTDSERSAAMRALDRGAPKGLDVAAAEKAAARMTAGWKDGPAVKVVEKPSDLPVKAPADARGYYDGKTLYVVASRNRDEHALAVTIAHEAVAHHSLRGMLGDDYAKLAKNIRLAIASGNKPLAEIRDYVRRTYVDDAGKFNLSREEEADEIAARAVELAVDKNGEFKPGFGFFKAVYSKIAEFLRGLGIDVKFTHTELQGMLVRANEALRGGGDRRGAPDLAAAAREPSAEKTRKALSQVDELFALPKSDKTDVAGIAADNDPAIKVKQLPDVMGRQAWVLTMPDGESGTITIRPESPFPHVYDMKLEEGDAKSISTERPGKGGDQVNKDDVWVDVSNLKSGGFGAVIYNIAATLAHNTGRIFIGDPHGMTELAVRRRTEQMLSSALKFGTTEHLAPHQRQIEGDKAKGIAPLDWTYGDHERNIRALIRTSLESNRNANPVTFERSTGRFVDSEGRELDDRAIRQIAELGPHRTIGAGVATLKRNAVLDSLVREEGGQGGSGGRRNGVLEKLLVLAGESPASTRGIFYARGDGLDARGEDAADEPQRKPYTGPGAHLIEAGRNALSKIINDAFLSVAPMSAGSDAARAVAKDYANAERLARWKWTQFDDVLKKSFTEEQRQKMWEAADEENVLRQTGADRTGKGLERLDPKERAVMDSLHDYGEQLLQRAKDVGMFKGEGLPYWTPRMAVMIGADGEYAKIPGEGKQATSAGAGRNVTVTAGSLKQRKYLTAEETEAAADALAKERGGKGAQLVRDIRTMPMAMARLERAIAGRELVDQIKELGTTLGVDTTSTTRGPNFFTLDHPAFQTYRYRPDVKFTEAMDKHLWQGLVDFAEKIGVSPERTADMRGRKWGYATTAGEVVTRFGGPETVLTHELGHQLDFKYGLADMLTRKGITAKELRALADLRYEGSDASATFRKYVRQGTEKIANMVHAYVHAKDRFAEVAPNTLEAFESFLDAHPELADLKKIRASLVLDTEQFSKRPPGEDFDVLPIYVSKDFEGPLKAILTETTGEFYKAMMQLKGKSMGLIMYSPLIHNAVEWGRALPMMPGKVLTFSIYFSGNKIKNDPIQMAQAIRDGMVPIGHRGNVQDITGLMEDPSLAPGRSWTAKLLGGAIGAVNDKAGLAVKKGVDAAGDFWHNTLLWDRVGDLQAGLYGSIRADLVRKGMGADTAGRLAAHFANRYAGALPNEAMSASARKVANFMLFSRSFTLGNLGVMKDMLTGFPPDIAAQIQRDAGDVALKAGRSVARRKAIAAFGLDIALLYVGNSLLQSAFDKMKRDKSLDEIEKGYVDRFDELIKRTKENPLDVLANPLHSLASLTPNSRNEPGKEDRIHYGTDDKGTNVYVRLPTGKIGEEFKNWLSSPLETLLRKQGTMMRPITQTIENDKGFGQRVYNPDDTTWAGMAKNMGRIAWNFMSQQVPADSIQAGADWAAGKADDTDKLKVVGPLAGLTFSHGAPGGPEVGEMYHENKVYQGKVTDIMPDVRHAIKVGDVEKAITMMEGIGMPMSQINGIIRKNEEPASRLSSKALKDYYNRASEESKSRMDNYGR